jgi:arylsulfatase A-like enzyme
VAHQREFFFERKLIRFIGALFAGVMLLGVSAAASANDRPNVLYVLTDDVGWGDLRPYNSESLVNTPTIQQLAAEGMLFTDAHTSAAKCAPSRYSVISGNYQWRGKKNWGQWNYKGGSQILAGQLTLGDIMQRAGYRTAFIGKSHLGGQFYRKNSNDFATATAPDADVDFSRPFQAGPLATGFDYSFLALRGIQGSPYAYFEQDLLLGNVAELTHWLKRDYGDTRIVQDGIGLPDWNTRQVGPDLLETAVDFIDTHHSSNLAHGARQPFFLYYNTQAVHSPRKPAFDLRGTPILRATGVTDRTDLIREIDVALGILLTELSSRGLLEDTLIVFSSDNGALRLKSELDLGHDALGGLRGAKGTIFEGGHRVPLIVKWGDGTTDGSRIEPGSVRDPLVGVQDLYTTLAMLVGIVPGEDQGRDSYNLLPVLLGEANGPVRDHMIHEGDVDGDGGKSRRFAFREGDWKLLLNGNQQPDQLYNIAVDPQESTNLIAQPSQASRIDHMLNRFMQLRGAERTAPVPDTSTVLVPDVSGVNLASAESEINFVGQSPSAGAMVPLGSSVDLVVSSVPPRCRLLRRPQARVSNQATRSPSVKTHQPVLAPRQRCAFSW